MRSSNRITAMFSVSMLSVLLLLSSAALSAPKGARAGAGRSRGRTVGGGRIGRAGRGYQQGSRHRADRSGLRVGIGFSNSYCNHRQWVTGRWISRTERVLVEPGHSQWQDEKVLLKPGHWEQKYVAAVEETVYDSRGQAHSVVVESGGMKKVWVPAEYQTRRVKVWIADRYETKEVRQWVPGYWVSSTSSCSFCGPTSWLSIGGVFRFRF